MPSHENLVPFGATEKKSKRSQIAAAGGRMLDAAFPQYAEQSPPTSEQRPAFMRPFPEWLVTELAAAVKSLESSKAAKKPTSSSHSCDPAGEAHG
ncbi:hypothetical protein OHA19_03470 [Streptomyces sp. NBC_00012]|uniref:hypothetical protein n=1 Tax=Streptomyces sp. NBC_00012 TaxID=2975621 RepID=UPI003254D81E